MSDHAITPFTVSVSDGEITDLMTRLGSARWPEQLPGPTWKRGVPVDYLRGVADYWASEFDWRAQENRINGYPQFTTEVDGQRIHFLHVRSAAEGATPLLLLHGWPGSFVEFLDVIDSFVDPIAHGGTEADAFHVVVPSLPGFGFSTPLADEGWGSRRMAAALAELMARLGYERYGAQGGDFGAFVAPDLGRVDSDHVIGIHVNAATVGFIPFGELSEEDEASLSEVERARLEHMANRPVLAATPALFAHGEADRAIPPAPAVGCLRRTSHDGPHVTLPGLGPVHQAEAPHAVLALLDQFPQM